MESDIMSMLIIFIIICAIALVCLYKRNSSDKPPAEGLRQCKEYVEQLRQQLLHSQSENDALNDKVKQLAAQVSSAAGEITFLEARNKLLADGNIKSNQEFAIICSHYNSELNRLSSLVSAMEARTKELEASHQQASPSSSPQSAKFQRLQSICDHQHETLIQLNNKHAALQQENCQLKEQLTFAEHKINFLLDSFPSLTPYLKNYVTEQIINKGSATNSTTSYLNKEDYELLSPTELRQLALDRYIASHKKTEWQIGRDYELSVGHEHIRQGYRVDFTGITEKYNDLGRDLIAYKGHETRIIQCKYWSKGKTIQEKHIAQLYGSCTYYHFEHPNEIVIPVFITNVRFSPTAKLFAQHLGVELQELHPLSEFPRIKCNIGHDSEGGTTMIYHLPMDPQYDRVKIENIGECYAYTVEEAESYGFRHAEKN